MPIIGRKIKAFYHKPAEEGSGSILGFFKSISTSANGKSSTRATFEVIALPTTGFFFKNSLIGHRRHDFYV